MTCSQADISCPVVPGTWERIVTPYDDPKAFDGTDTEAAKYDECYQQIARNTTALPVAVGKKTNLAQ